MGKAETSAIRKMLRLFGTKYRKRPVNLFVLYDPGTFLFLGAALVEFDHDR